MYEVRTVKTDKLVEDYDLLCDARKRITLRPWLYIKYTEEVLERENTLEMQEHHRRVRERAGLAHDYQGLVSYHDQAERKKLVEFD